MFQRILCRSAAESVVRTAVLHATTRRRPQLHHGHVPFAHRPKARGWRGDGGEEKQEQEKKAGKEASPFKSINADFGEVAAHVGELFPRRAVCC